MGLWCLCVFVLCDVCTSVCVQIACVCNLFHEGPISNQVVVADPRRKSVDLNTLKSDAHNINIGWFLYRNPAHYRPGSLCLISLSLYTPRKYKTVSIFQNINS